MAITQEKNIQMLEKLPDGNFKIKYPETKASQVKFADDTTVESHKLNKSNPHSVTPSQIGAEPAFTKNSAFNKNFGTTAGTVCQGNDSRLSNSRKSNNTFDNVATARTNLGLTGNSNTTHYHDSRYVQTRVYNGKLQYYDGGWKDVVMPIVTKPKISSMYKNQTSRNVYYTVASVSGEGFLYSARCEITTSYNSNNGTLKIKIVLDGVEHIFDGATIGMAQATGAEDEAIDGKSLKLEGQFYFKNSLVVQFASSEESPSSGQTIFSSAVYGLV